MEETRVEKYKKYRQSFVTEGSLISKDKETKDISSERVITTATLPLDQVLSTVTQSEREAAFLRRRKLNRILFIIGVSIIGISLVALLIVFGVIAFQG